MDGIANFDHLTQNFNTHWWSIFDLLVFWGKFMKKVIHNVPWKESMQLILREWRNLENYRILVNKDYLRDGLQVFHRTPHHLRSCTTNCNDALEFRGYTTPGISTFSKRIQRNHNQLALLVSTPLVSQETITVKLAACGIRAGIVLVILVILFVILVMFFCHRGHPFVILVLFFAILVILANLNCHPGHFLYLREAFHFCYLDQVTFFFMYTPWLQVVDLEHFYGACKKGEENWKLKKTFWVAPIWPKNG